MAWRREFWRHVARRLESRKNPRLLDAGRGAPAQIFSA
jgi:hypothetical protein